MAFVQMETPVELLGKVMSFVFALTMIAQPLGFLMFGFLFEELYHLPWLVIIVANIIAIAVTMLMAKHFKRIKASSEVN
jgi:positive regulator of sigma E activity